MQARYWLSGRWESVMKTFSSSTPETTMWWVEFGGGGWSLGMMGGVWRGWGEL